MEQPDPRRLIEDALFAASEAETDPSRRSVEERAAEAALARGLVDMAREVLLALEDAGARAWLHAELGSVVLSSGDMEAARRHIEAARKGLDQQGRWVPRGSRWMGPESARARLAALCVRLGDRQTALGLAGSLPLGRRARARAWHALVETSFEAEGPQLEGDWASAREAALAVADPVDGLAARVALAEAACRGGSAVRAASLAHSDALGAFSDPLRRARLGLSVGRVLAEAGRPDAAARLWRRALDPLLEQDGLGSRAAAVVAEVALLQLEHLGPAEAVETVERAVTRAGAAPLSPAPDLRFAWRQLYSLALAEPLLAAPLRDWLRVQARVPPGWCYVLGLLELETGHLQRAQWAAEALDRGQELNPSEIESGLLAALLWLRLGAVDKGVASAAAVMEADMEGWSRAVPGRTLAPASPPTLLAEALFRAGQRSAGAAVARSVPAAGDRVRLLRTAAEEAWAEGSAEEAAALSAEAALAIEAASSAGGISAGEASSVLILLEQTGQDEIARSTVDALLAQAEDAPGELAVATLCALTQALEGCGSAAAERVRRTLSEQISRTADPEARAHQLLDWLDLAWPAPVS